ncbi:MAG: AAA family ATPase [Thiohalomonadales bacterium]
MNYKTTFFTLPDEGIWKGDQSFAPYLFTEDIAITVDIALATERPLLISGPPGCGKTTLAQALAGMERKSFLKHTLTSRSRLEDLTAGIDQLQRLHDAHAAAAGGDDNKLLDEWVYQNPGLFWWAFEKQSAYRRGGNIEDVTKFEKQNRFRRPEYPGLEGETPGLVILLDEIDKAEPDLPNDLLEPLDSRRFTTPTGREIKAPASEELQILCVITTNSERELPPAFLRRCVSLELDSPDVETLIDIADYHVRNMPGKIESNPDLYTEVAKKFQDIQKESKDLQRRPPGTSEYLDAVKACLKLGLNPGDKHLWPQIESATLRKQRNENGK